MEAGNQRIQAFSSGGHPVQAFPSLPTPYWIPLFTEETDPASVTYVAMSVEIKGYIYVLSIEENGYVSNQFRLDIYTPDGGEHLLRQRDINVGSMTVDLWRNLYTQNYATILGPGKPHRRLVKREWFSLTQPQSGSEEIEMQYNNIQYPVNLGNWEFGSNNEWVAAYYNDWAGGNPPEPFSGGWGLVIWNNQESYGYTPFNIWWVGPNQFALQTTPAFTRLSPLENGAGTLCYRWLV